MVPPKKENYTEEDVRLARFAKALGHPARIAILRHLASLNTCCFNEISKELPIADSTVSQHMTELKDAGLIQGSFEPPKVKYCINIENWNLAKKYFGEFTGIKIAKMKKYK
jgi:DNA-binding transcriptional ArsR family regulator